MLFKVIEVKTFSFDSHCSKIPIFTIKKRYKGLNFNKNVTRYLYVVVNCFAYYVNSYICYMLCVNHLKGSVELKMQAKTCHLPMLQILLSSKNRLCPEGHPQNKESQFPEARFHSRWRFSSRDCIVPFYPGLTGLWPVKMCPVMDDVTEKRVTRRHPNRILPEVKKGQLWASKPG